MGSNRHRLMGCTGNMGNSGKVRVRGHMFPEEGLETVRQQTIGVRGQGGLLLLGIESTRGSMGTQDLLSKEPDRTMVWDTEAEDKEIPQEMVT